MTLEGWQRDLLDELAEIEGLSAAQTRALCAFLVFDEESTEVDDAVEIIDRPEAEHSWLDLGRNLERLRRGIADRGSSTPEDGDAIEAAVARLLSPKPDLRRDHAGAQSAMVQAI